MRGGAPFQDMEKNGRDGGDGRSPSSPQATLSRYSLSPLVEVIGLEEFGFKS